ncbi:MAG: type II secretion system F family protein, partial [Planctomycetaceae bacterium]|nr:type II secretion system F family protein [Planctomycetaceae bacterium]
MTLTASIVIATSILGLDITTASVLVGMGVAGAIAAVVYGLQGGESTIEDRLDVLAGKKSANADLENAVTREALVKEGVEGLSGFLSGLAERFGNLKLFFIQADSPIKVETFLLICGGAGLVGGFLAFITRCPLPFIPLGIVLGAAMPWVWLIMRRGRRFKKFASQMPDAMELLSRALRSGHSVASAMKVVVDELPDPISREFNIAYEEQNLGIPLEIALKNLYYRMPNLDYKFFSMAVSIQKQTGGDLAEVLDKIGKIIRDRFRIMGQVQALTGEGRISGIVLMALPILLFFAVWRLNPDYVMLLFTDEIGRKMIGVAIVLQILGAVVIQ